MKSSTRIMDPQNPNIPSSLDSARIETLPSSFYYIPNFLTPAEASALLQKIPPNRWTQLSHRRLQAIPSTLTAKANVLIAAPLPSWLTTSPPVAARFEALGVFKDTEHGAANHCLVNEYRPGQGIMPHEDGAAYSPVVATVSLGGSIVLDLYDKGEKGRDSKQQDGSDEEDGGGGGGGRGGSNDMAPSMENLNVNVEGEHRHHHHDPSQPTWRVLQEPGSLLITTGEAYESMLHGISPITLDNDLGPDTVANWSLLGDATRYEAGVYERETRISLTYRDVLRVSKVGIGILGPARR